MKFFVVLVCGGRMYREQAHVNATLSNARAYYMAQGYDDIVIIHGNAGGADGCAAIWAGSNGVVQARVPALWGLDHKGAGPRRNAAMAALRPDVCLAFPGGNGTADMVRRCKEAGIPTYEV